MKVTVSAPATTANLGPGFDCLGAALDLRLSLRAIAADRTSWDATDAELTDGSLVMKAIEAVCADHPPLALEMDARIPLARGLGSSAAAIAAGLLVGCALVDRDPDPAELLRIGLPLEGHPDNLAPALYGGMTVVVPGPHVLRFEPVSSVAPVILVPDERLSTAEARDALPDEVARADAVANVARSSGLVALLTGAVEPTTDRLLACTEDRLHQPHRASLMPASAETVERLRAAGIPAAISGAGPSVVCLLTDEISPRFHEIVSGLKDWTVLEVGWSLDGARITSVDR